MLFSPATKEGFPVRVHSRACGGKPPHTKRRGRRSPGRPRSSHRERHGSGTVARAQVRAEDRVTEHSYGVPAVGATLSAPLHRLGSLGLSRCDGEWSRSEVLQATAVCESICTESVSKERTKRVDTSRPAAYDSASSRSYRLASLHASSLAATCGILGHRVDASGAPAAMRRGHSHGRHL